MAIRLSQTELRDKNAAIDVESISNFPPFSIIVWGEISRRNKKTRLEFSL